MCVYKDPAFVLCHALIINLADFKNLKEIFKISRVQLLHCFLLGTILFALNTHCILVASIAFVLPFAFRYPVHNLIRKDSGANFLMFSLAVISFICCFVDEEMNSAILLLNLYVYTMILFKSLPAGVIYPLVLFAAGMGLKMIVDGHISNFLLSVCLFVFLFTQKMMNQRNTCLKRRSAFFVHLFIFLVFLLGFSLDLPMIPLLAVYFWVYLAGQKLCDACVFAFKCKDLVLIQIVTLSPVLVFTGILNMGKYENILLNPWIVFAGLPLLFLQKFTTAPMNTQSLLQTPCVLDYVDNKINKS